MIGAVRSDVRVGIVGGGLAGMAAAAALAQRGLAVELFEARRQAGGRAASFRDPSTGELFDHCQHVSMGCCTNLTDLCQQAGLAAYFRRERTLHFVGPDGRVDKFSASRWLPAPVHLILAFGNLSFLNLAERLAIAKAIRRLTKNGDATALDATAMADWLREQGQSPQAIERFWSVVLASALGDTLDRCSAWQARQVFVLGFLNNRSGYELLVPAAPLAELFGRRLPDWLAGLGVAVRADSPVSRVIWDRGRAAGVELHDSRTATFDAVILAAPWFRLNGLLGADAPASLADLHAVANWQGSPIAGAHLWFDRPLTDLPHAVLVGKLSQWLFRPTGDKTPGGHSSGHYYQVVISGAREIGDRPREQTVERIVAELRDLFPAGRDARLLRWRLVVEQNAVFSPLPGLAANRPKQATAVDNLFLAGDWTQTGWPATMEGAVRSGRLAAEALLAWQGRRTSVLQRDLPVGRLARWLVGSAP